jgi:citrate lyase subunit beta/citryl-CoA lyase
MKNRLRRTMMFIPGNNSAMLKDAFIYGADALMFDLEDSVSPLEKDAARLLVYMALKTIDYKPCERVVRINALSSPHGHADVEAMVAAGVEVIRMPKTETAQDVLDCELAIAAAETKYRREPGSVSILAAIESAQGVLNAVEIAKSSKRLVGIALGAEDFCADMGVRRSTEGSELQLARQTIVLAAKATGIDALDTVFSNVADEEGFIAETLKVKTLGFSGKSVIHPRQIEPVHRVFAPSQEEIQQAKRLITALQEAEQRGSGVIAVDGKMIDRPVVLRAQRTLQLAEAMGVLQNKEALS